MNCCDLQTVGSKQALWPGDVIRLEGEVTEVTPSKTRPQGTVKVKWTAYNQHGSAVYTFTPIGIVPRRASAS